MCFACQTKSLGYRYHRRITSLDLPRLSPKNPIITFVYPSPQDRYTWGCHFILSTDLWGKLGWDVVVSEVGCAERIALQRKTDRTLIIIAFQLIYWIYVVSTLSCLLCFSGCKGFELCSVQLGSGCWTAFARNKKKIHVTILNYGFTFLNDLPG